MFDISSSFRVELYENVFCRLWGQATVQKSLPSMIYRTDRESYSSVVRTTLRSTNPFGVCSSIDCLIMTPTFWSNARDKNRSYILAPSGCRIESQQGLHELVWNMYVFVNEEHRDHVWSISGRKYDWKLQKRAAGSASPLSQNAHTLWSIPVVFMLVLPNPTCGNRVIPG